MHFNVSQMLLSLYPGSINLHSICLNLIQAGLRKGDEGFKFICVLFQPHLSWHHEIHPEQHQHLLKRNWSLPEGVHLAPYLGNQSHKPKHFPRRLSLKNWQPTISPYFWEDREWRLFVMLRIMALKIVADTFRYNGNKHIDVSNWSAFPMSTNILMVNNQN